MIAGLIGLPRAGAVLGMPQDGAIALLVPPRRRRLPSPLGAGQAALTSAIIRRRQPSRPVLAAWPVAR